MRGTVWGCSSTFLSSMSWPRTPGSSFVPVVSLAASVPIAGLPIPPTGRCVCATFNSTAGIGPIAYRSQVVGSGDHSHRSCWDASSSSLTHCPSGLACPPGSQSRVCLGPPPERGPPSRLPPRACDHRDVLGRDALLPGLGVRCQKSGWLLVEI